MADTGDTPEESGGHKRAGDSTTRMERASRVYALDARRTYAAPGSRGAAAMAATAADYGVDVGLVEAVVRGELTRHVIESILVNYRFKLAQG